MSNGRMLNVKFEAESLRNNGRLPTKANPSVKD